MEHELVGKVRAKVVAWRHGNPASSLKLIMVAGLRGKTTTALLLSEMLQEAGSSVMTLTNQGSMIDGKPLTMESYDASATALQEYLSLAKKKNVKYVIVEVNDELVATHSLSTLPIEMSIITNDAPAAHALLQQPSSYLVAPTGFGMSDQGVAPHQMISYGTDESADAQLANVTLRRKGTEIDLVIDHQTKLSVATYLVGRANAFNVTSAVSAAYVLAADTSTFQEGVARLERVAGNYEYLPAEGLFYEIVVDGANVESSIDLVLTSASKLKRRRLMVAVDSTVPSELYANIKQSADRLIAVSDSALLPGIELANTTKGAVDLLKRGAKREDLVLLLGRDFARLNEDGTTAAHKLIGEPSE